MGRWALGIVGLCVFAATPCAAKTVEAESRIIAVTVFPDRAGVTRQATLKLSKGPQTVELSPLPSHVEPDSVTAKGVGEAEVTLSGVRLVTKQLETAQDPKVKDLEEDIRKLSRRQQQLHNTKEVLRKEREYLDSIQAASSEQIGKDLVTKSPKASEAEGLLEFLDEELLENFEREQQADVELEDSTQALDKLRRELAQLTEGRHRQETAMLVDLDAHTSGSFELEVSYRVPGAGWQPSYEARAFTAADEVELVSHALVRQRTGEDWEEAVLTLSTAKPAIVGSMPELEPWFLRPWEPVGEKKDRRLMREAALEPAAPAAGEGAAEDQEAQVAYAAVEAQGPAVTFRLPNPVSIPSDWQPHKVPISAARLAVEFAYETTPRLVAYAFLRAKVANTSEAFYLAGPVSVFLDGAFVATAQLEQIAPSEEFDLYLGADERVKVERKQLKEHVAVSLLPGLRGKTKSTDYEFLTTIENFTSRRITVTAFDQIPVSEREEIVVESVKRLPEELEEDEEKPGVFRWTFELIPNQKQELRLSYRVRHPVEMPLQ